MAKHKEGAMSVESVDVLDVALNEAMERIEAMKPTLGKTLVEEYSAEEWKAWDASGEMALVADKDGLDGTNSLDDDEPQAA